MKQTISLPLYSIYSLIRELDELKENPETAKQFEGILSSLNALKETFMPLIDEYKDCMNMPDIDATIDSDSDINTNSDIDWEQRRYELTKAAMQGRISSLEKNFNYKSMMPTIAKEAVMMAETMIKEMKGQTVYDD